MNILCDIAFIHVHCIHTEQAAERACFPLTTRVIISITHVSLAERRLQGNKRSKIVRRERFISHGAPDIRVEEVVADVFLDVERALEVGARSAVADREADGVVNFRNALFWKRIKLK